MGKRKKYVTPVHIHNRSQKVFVTFDSNREVLSLWIDEVLFAEFASHQILDLITEKGESKWKRKRSVNAKV